MKQRKNNIRGKNQPFSYLHAVKRRERKYVFVFQRDLRSEVRTFLSDANSAFAHHLTDSEWIARLAYLSCIFDKLNTLNLSLQGLNINILTLSDKVNAFTKKLQRWAVRAESGDFKTELHDMESLHQRSSPKPTRKIPSIFSDGKCGEL